MDVFEQLLTSSSSRGSVNPETLEYIGQRASNDYLEKKASLNSAIVKLAAQYPDLNNEHIHRIVEFANNATFQHLFEKNHDKNVHFDIADPGVVIRDLRDGGSPAHDGRVLHNKADYFRPPLQQEEKDGSGVGDPESGLADLMNREQSSGQFGQGEPIQKVAHAAGLDPSWEGSANPVNDVFAEHKRLERAKDEVTAAYETADLMYKQARAEFFKAAKAEILSPNGVGFRVVIEALEKVAGAPLLESEMVKIAEELLKGGVSAQQLEVGKTKTAGKIINLEHPFIQTASGMMKCASELVVANLALNDLEAALEKTGGFLRSGLARAGLMAGSLGAAAAGSGQMGALAHGAAQMPHQFSQAAKSQGVLKSLANGISSTGHIGAPGANPFMQQMPKLAKKSNE